MTEVLFATNNPGKLADAQRFAQDHDYRLLCPNDLNIAIDVVEDGTTFSENADKKYYGFMEHVTNPNMWVIADDSGIEIPALNNKPGVYSRRWAGHEMTDQEIVDYCLAQLDGVDDRRARFTGVLAVGRPRTKPHHIAFGIEGELLKEPAHDAGDMPGFPYRSLFYLPQYEKMLYEIHDIPYADRPDILTHREQGLKDAFQYIAEHEED